MMEYKDLIIKITKLLESGLGQAVKNLAGFPEDLESQGYAKSKKVGLLKCINLR
jgi:hypothetical protein